MRRVVIHTGVVLSTSEGAMPRMKLPFKMFAGAPLSSGRQWFPWIHLADEVGAIRFLMENGGASGPFNLAAPNPVTNAKFSKALGRAMHRPAVMPVPAAALRLMFGEMSTVLLDGQRAMPEGLQNCGYQFRFSDAESALRDLIR